MLPKHFLQGGPFFSQLAQFRFNLGFESFQFSAVLHHLKIKNHFDHQSLFKLQVFSLILRGNILVTYQKEPPTRNTIRQQ